MPLTAIPVRTLAFDLPTSTVSFDITAADAKADGKTEPHEKRVLVARKNQFSTPVALPPGSYLASSKAFKTPAPFNLPDSEGARFLLLILPTSDGAFVIFPIPDAIGKIGPGERFLINATTEDIAVRFGKQVATVKPGHSEYLRPPRPAPADKRVEVEMANKVGNGWLTFNSTMWPLDPQARSFVLVLPDPVTGTPRVRNLSEVP